MAPDAWSQPARIVSRALGVRPSRTPRKSRGGGRLVVVSNRVVRNDDAQSGGLAMTMRHVLREHGGLWFGWSGRIEEQPALNQKRDLRDGFDYATVDLCQRDYDDYYAGFPSRTLYPLLQSRLHDMEFDRKAMAAWFRVNTQLAARLKTLLQPDDVIWVNDFHLLPLARELRAVGVRNRIGLFLHAALPPRDILASMPCHREVFGCAAAYDLVGVQTARDLNALRDYLTHCLGARSDGRGDVLRLGAHALRLSAFPVGIDVARMAALAQGTDRRAFFQRFRESLGLRELLIGVDRPDHAKGLGQRLRALDHLLQQSPHLSGSFTMLQIAPPARCDMPRYRELDRELDRNVSDVNGKYAGPDWAPVRYIKKGFRQQMLAGYLRSAGVGLMTPLHDGMNLVAKEYVACQDPADPGVLVLSRFAGAARELTDAVLVNPLDVDDLANGIRTAMGMPLAERRQRWHALMAALRRQDLHRWSGDFLQALQGHAAGAPRRAATMAVSARDMA